MSTKTTPRPHRTRRLLAIIAGALLMTGAIQPLTAQAADTYKCYSGGLSSKLQAVRYGDVNSTWVGFFDTARSRWANAGVGVSFTKTSVATSTITAGRYSDTWYGLYTPHGSYYSIQVNARTLDNDTPDAATLELWAKSTSTHEFGHAVRLPDNPPTTKTTLMSHSRNRSTVGSPTAYDKANVNYCYGSLPSSKTSSDPATMIMAADYPTYDTLADAVNEADVVVRGSFVHSAADVLLPDVSPTDGDAQTNPQFGVVPSADALEDLRVPITTSTLEVSEVLKGSLKPGQDIQVSQLGGELDGVRYREASTTLLADASGDEFLLLLSQHNDGTYDMINADDGGWVVEGESLTGLNGQSTTAPFSKTSLPSLSQAIRSAR